MVEGRGPPVFFHASADESRQGIFEQRITFEKKPLQSIAWTILVRFVHERSNIGKTTYQTRAIIAQQKVASIAVTSTRKTRLPSRVKNRITPPATSVKIRSVLMSNCDRAIRRFVNFHLKPDLHQQVQMKYCQKRRLYRSMRSIPKSALCFRHRPNGDRGRRKNTTSDSDRGQAVAKSWHEYA